MLVVYGQGRLGSTRCTGGRYSSVDIVSIQSFPQVRLRKRFNARGLAMDVELAVVNLKGIDRHRLC